ncbi:MAG TPA: hypothetical protein DD725_05775 [Deltaproteobacteria bacterium]|nr:MAG: hypothetical protein A2Z89_07715 [Deltaproteobacteria bacterium GWA2_43_19]HBR17101.1 hypothetical protein [Deltaproteobacteria bacterium]
MLYFAYVPNLDRLQMKFCSPSAESALPPIDIGEESCNIACAAPCLILAGTGLKVIERLQQLGGKWEKINLFPLLSHYYHYYPSPLLSFILIEVAESKKPSIFLRPIFYDISP